jgi:hypothetical protein
MQQMLWVQRRVAHIWVSISGRQASLALNHFHRRRLVSIAVWLHDDLNILIERDQEAQQAFDRKLAELAAQHLGDIGLATPNIAAVSTCLRPRFFRIVSILNTSCALTKCSSALGTPMSLNTLRLPVL